MSTGTTETITKPSGRDARGCFLPGAVGNRSGNPTTRVRRLQRQFRKHVMDALESVNELTEKDPLIKAIAFAWVDEARNNAAARRDLREYLFGRDTGSEVLATIERIQGQIAKMAKGTK